jgi:hypothetical protein
LKKCSLFYPNSIQYTLITGEHVDKQTFNYIERRPNRYSDSQEEETDKTIEGRRRGAQKLMGENLKVVWAEFSTLS